MEGFRRILLLALFAVLAAWFADGAELEAVEPPKRARRPKFDPSAAAQIFFDDVFSAVSGDRPQNTPRLVAEPAVEPSPSNAEEAERSVTRSAWAAFVSAATLEDEVKSLRLNLNKNITTPIDFAARGHSEVRRHLSLLAVLFAVIHEYEGTVRWKTEASLARDRLARAASNAKAGGNANVFQEAKDRRDDLENLLGGGSLGENAAASPTEWGRIAERALLMQRLDEAWEGLSAWTANDREFADHGEAAVHEAEMIALLAEVLTKKGLDDAEDADYAQLSRDMWRASRDIVRASKEDDYARGRAAAGLIGNSCAACHESYR